MSHPHGPENAEHELKKAYHHALETGVVYEWYRPENIRGQLPPDVKPERVFELYRKAYDLYRNDDRLGAERWARTVKHLARAYWHEAMVSYLDAGHVTDLPFLKGAADEYDLKYSPETTQDLIESVAGHVPPGLEEMPEEMNQFVVRARELLGKLDGISPNLEFLRAECIKAAHEYGRVVECLALAYEADARRRAA